MTSWVTGKMRKGVWGGDTHGFGAGDVGDRMGWPTGHWWGQWEMSTGLCEAAPDGVMGWGRPEPARGTPPGLGVCLRGPSVAAPRGDTAATLRHGVT